MARGTISWSGDEGRDLFLYSGDRGEKAATAVELQGPLFNSLCKVTFINHRKELIWSGKTKGRQRLPRADGLVPSLKVPALRRSTQAEGRL